MEIHIFILHETWQFFWGEAPFKNQKWLTAMPAKLRTQQRQPGQVEMFNGPRGPLTPAEEKKRTSNGLNLYVKRKTREKRNGFFAEERKTHSWVKVRKKHTSAYAFVRRVIFTLPMIDHIFLLMIISGKETTGGQTDR